MFQARELLVCSLLFFSTATFAQQSYFNVPNSQKTEKGRHFVQEQFNVTRTDDHVSNLTYDYGVFENAEFGFNILGLDDQPESKGGQLTNFMLNGQYFYDLGSGWVTSVGGLAGFLQDGTANDYFFLNIRKNFPSDANIVFGFFDGSTTYLGQGHADWYIGFELPLIENKLSLSADYINGTTSSSVTVIGLDMNITTKWTFAVGLQLPSFYSHNDSGLVFELSYY